MRLPPLLPVLATLAIARAEWVHINNHLSSPLWITQVTGSGDRGNTQIINAYGNWSIPQSDADGVAIKVTPEENDIDIVGKGVLTLGYTKQPEGWIYYDIGVYLYYPFPGAKTKLSGPGGDNDWSDGIAHPQHTIGYYGAGDLYLDIGYQAAEVPNGGLMG